VVQTILDSNGPLTALLVLDNEEGLLEVELWQGDNYLATIYVNDTGRRDETIRRLLKGTSAWTGPERQLMELAGYPGGDRLAFDLNKKFEIERIRDTRLPEGAEEPATADDSTDDGAAT
jgi:hypothetical protein